MLQRGEIVDRAVILILKMIHVQDADLKEELTELLTELGVKKQKYLSAYYKSTARCGH
jgi:hypothetical protein